MGAAAYPDGKTYEVLYRRYLRRPPHELLHAAGFRAGEHVLDIGGGTGRLSAAALGMGAGSVVLVDASKAMARHAPAGIEVIVADAREALVAFAARGRRFDLVASQQAVSYWLNEATAALVAKVLHPKGRLAFNVFWRKPSEKPTVREYELAGRSYVEVSWLIGDRVHHVQVAEGMLPHVTTFAWLSREEIERLLAPHFEWSRRTDGNTDIWVAARKAEGGE